MICQVIVKQVHPEIFTKNTSKKLLKNSSTYSPEMSLYIYLLIFLKDFSNNHSRVYFWICSSEHLEFQYPKVFLEIPLWNTDRAIINTHTIPSCIVSGVLSKKVYNDSSNTVPLGILHLASLLLFHFQKISLEILDEVPSRINLKKGSGIPLRTVSDIILEISHNFLLKFSQNSHQTQS